MGFRRAVLVLLPFLDCRIRNSKSQQFRKLRHGQRKVDSLLAEVFSEGRRSGLGTDANLRKWVPFLSCIEAIGLLVVY